MRRIIVRGLNADIAVNRAVNAADDAEAAAMAAANSASVASGQASSAATAASQAASQAANLAAAGVQAATSANATNAQAARIGAEIARDEAQALIIADLGTTDGQTSALIGSPSSQTSVALSANYARVFTPEEFGAVGDGATDDTTAVQAAINASADNGIVRLAGKTYRCDGQLSVPAGAVHITSDLSPAIPPNWTATEVTNGALLDLRYGGSGYSDAKIQALQPGTFELSHIGIVDKGASDNLWINAPYPVIRVHDCLFQGNMVKYRETCDQDVIRVGAPYFVGQIYAPGVVDGATNPMGSYVTNNYFTRIRRAVQLGNAANGFVIKGNAICRSCGSSQNPDAPLVLDSGHASDGTDTAHVQGVVIGDNTVSLSGYAHGLILTNNSAKNFVSGNGWWDREVGLYVSAVHVDEDLGCIDNWLSFDSYSYTNSLPISGITSATGSNKVLGKDLSWHSGRFDIWPSGHRHYFNGNGDDEYLLEVDAVRGMTRLRGENGVALGSDPTLPNAGDAGVFVRTSNPNGVVTAYQGDVVLGGRTMYIKRDGAGATNTGWAAVNDPGQRLDRKGGHVAIASATWVPVDTSLDITLSGLVPAACPIVYLSALISDEAPDIQFDVGIVKNGEIIDFVSGGSQGISGWYTPGGSTRPACGSVPFTVAPVHLDVDEVTFRLLAKNNGSLRTVFASSQYPLTFGVTP